MFSLIIELVACGFGWSGGLIPELRLGIVRIAWCRGSLLSRVEQWKAALWGARAKLARAETLSSDRPAGNDGDHPGPNNL